MYSYFSIILRRKWQLLVSKGWKRVLLYCFLGTDLIDPFWYFKIKIQCCFSRKIKIGFGPILTGEDDLSVRKWRIDPIIDALNERSDIYCAGFFIHPEEMKKFDWIVIVKNFNPHFIPIMEELKEKKSKFFYDVVDNPNEETRYRFYFCNHPKFIELIDGVILSSPAHRFWLKEHRKIGSLIEHPILNTSYKKCYKASSEIRILAQGYYENLVNLHWLGDLLPEVSLKIGKPIRLIFHSEMKLRDSEWIKYIKWDVKNCFEVMLQSDIAVTIKDLHKLHQYTKPSTKVIAYMAAGLPVICKPSVADMQVIEHRVNGFFCFTKEDWIHWICALASSVALRRQIGTAARSSVARRFSKQDVFVKYLSLFERVREVL